MDYTNVDAIAKALEDNNIDTVINCVGVVGDPSPLYALISAADKAKTTKRFIPNLWSAILYEPE